MYIYIYIHTISLYLIKSVSWFLIFFECSLMVLLSNTKSSFVSVTHLFAWNTRANSVTTLQRCDCYTRDSFAWMFESCILPSLITKLNFWTKNCYINFWQYVTIFMSYTIQCFKMWRESFIRTKLILKFHKDCNFAGQFHIHLFFLLIFLLSFLVNLRIALYQQGLIDSYQL